MKVNAPRARASFLALLLALPVGCSAASAPVQQGGATPSGTPLPSAEPPAAPSPERAAYERAKPILEKYCATCHTKGGAASSEEALEHFSMDGYPFGGHHANEIGAVVRMSLGASGRSPTMPRGKPGAVKGDELAAILAWADAFGAAHLPAVHKQEKDHHTPHKH